MTPEEPTHTRKQIETRMRTLYLCAIALLQYEKELKQQLSEVNVSHQFQTSSSGDKKTLSPEEQMIVNARRKLKPRRDPPDEQSNQSTDK